MPNLTKPASYPYGLKAPVPHDDLNEICEQYSKAPNFDDGSAHAPSADIELSGAGTGGFSFDTSSPFPFFGYLNVSSGLRFTAPTSGQVRFNSTVAIDIFSTNMTIQSGAQMTLASGATITVSSGATVTHASGSTTNLTGAVNVRGTMTFKTTANGGPGIASWEGTGAELNGSAGAVGSWGGSWTFSGNLTASGNTTFNGAATFNDPMVIADTITRSGTTAYEVLRTGTGPDSSTTVTVHSRDVLFVPDLGGNRVWTLSAPPSNEVITAIIHWPTQTGTRSLELKDGSRTLCVLNSAAKARDGSIATVSLVHRGADGWTVRSIERGAGLYVGADASTSIDAWLYHTITAPDLSADRVYTLANPPANTAPFDVTIHWTAQAAGPRNLEIISSAGSHASIDAGADDAANGVAAVVIGYNGTQYYLKSQSGPYSP